MPTAISTIFGFIQNRFIHFLLGAIDEHPAHRGQAPFRIHIHFTTVRRAS